ncbi:MAG: asparagine synthase (glutamine-hydrolyzing) [Cryomorphaceae bacterium]
MCGIAGIFGLEELPDASRRVQIMLDKLAHRGPNSEGVYEGKNAVLGHRRLSIIDLSEAANQPFHSQDGRYVLIYNGELYNYKEVRESLVNYRFLTNSDSEVVMAAMIEWGPACLQKFNGMFAFAFWDNHESKLWLVRDRLGIKPLYYTQVGNAVVFASEVRSILASGLISPTLDKHALADYMRYQTVHAPNTLVQGVKMVEAGSYLLLEDNEVQKSEYWKPWQTYHEDKDAIVIKKNVRDHLTKAVERRLVSDVPFGAFLSGGIDSSLIVGVIRERLDLPIDTFNVSFDESEFSEAKYARTIADKFKTAHHEVVLQPQRFLECLPEALAAMDHPSGDGPNTWIVSKETKSQGISMALSGLGGDELFGGYDVFKRIPSIADRHWILSFPAGLRAMVGNLLTAFRPSVASAKTKEILTADYFDLEHLYPVFRKVWLDDKVGGLIGNPLPKNQVQSIIAELERFNGFGTLPTLSRIGIAEMSTYMQNVLLRDTDQMSMAHALEVRVPFLDHELVEYAMHIPDSVKYPTSPKQLLVESFADLLPHEVVNRPKMGFVLPWEHWMKNELKDFCEERLRFLACTPYFEEKATLGMWQRFLKGDPMVSWSRMWPMVTLADWMQMNHVE